MAYPTLAAVLDAVESKLGAATGLSRSQAYDELTESIPDTPLLQVYPEAWEPDKSAAARTLKSQRAEHVTVHADYYAHQRANIGEDMAVLVTGIQAIVVVLRAQDSPNELFGLEGILRFEWRGERATFNYGKADYVGMRFIIDVWTKNVVES
jgi:hypothetical protein